MTDPVGADLGPLPRVLVLMATYNGDRWLAEQLASIAMQREVSLSIIACDDGSTDETIAVIETAARRGVPVSLHSSSAAGGSAARNFLRLIREVDPAGSDFVALADQDDVWYPQRLARATGRLAAEHSDAYSSSVRAVWQNGRTRMLHQSSEQTDGDYLFEGAGQGCTFVFRASSFIVIQTVLRSLEDRTSNVHYHDWLVYALARVLGMRWSFDATPCMDYRQHASNDTGARGSGAAVAKRLTKVRSGWYACQIALIAAVCEATAPHVAAAREFRQISAPTQAWGRWRQLVFVIRKGRRKWSDRTLLAIFAVAGWLRHPSDGRSV